MNLRRILITPALAAAFFIICSPAFALLFTAEDKSFTIDLPSSWVKVEPQGNEVLSLKRDAATVKISLAPYCHDFYCIEALTNKALDFVKSKKFRILENTYSGEIIKRTEFSTGDPLLSFNYSAASVDFTTAHFLADGNAYYVGIKGIPYVEADLLLSFIAPAAKPTDASQGAVAPRVTLDEHDIDDMDDEVHQQPAAPQAPAQPSDPAPKPAAFDVVKIVFLALAGYLFILTLVFLLHIFMRGKKMPDAANPRSSYPVKGERLYGSPDLFFRLHDNQGNNYIAVCSRWGSVFIGLGLIGAALFFALKIIASYAYANGQIAVHAAIVNTVISLSSLLSVLGFVIFIMGVMFNLLFASKYYFYDDKGALAFKCVRKGFYLFREEYIAADDKSAIIFRMRRARFALRRRWIISDNAGEIAQISERSLFKALLRMLFGHMGGFLRADYDIKGRVGSSGAALSCDSIFTRFRAEIDKPEAVNAGTILIASAVIFMRERDKWHPWVN